MSSRVFKAKAGHTKERPQLCGLSNGEIAKGDSIMYLVCHGADARPEYQIKVTKETSKTVTYKGRSRTVTDKDYGMDDGRRFRSVFGGWKMNPDTGKREKEFQWQEYKGLDADGEENWSPVKCWSHVVFASAAEDLGYEVRRKRNGKWSMTTAHDGDRAVGNEHTLDTAGVNAMEELARAACTDEELGLVPPREAGPSEKELAELETVAVERAENADEEADLKLDAEAMGMTLDQWKGVLARQNPSVL